MSLCKFGDITRLQAAVGEFYQDSWCILYSYLAKELFKQGGFEGEIILRDGVRRYGIWRGAAQRKRLLENNVKVNMRTLYNEGRDRPHDARYRCVVTLKDEYFYQETHVCAYCDTFEKYGAKEFGRIYCEEFHQAAYGTYAHGKGRVNLTRTKTQDGDDRCFFYVVLRPEYLTDEERALSFAEYDPGYEDPHYSNKLDLRECNARLWISSYYFMLEAAIDHLGERGRQIIAAGLRACAVEHARLLQEMAHSFEREADKDFVHKYMPLSLDSGEIEIWKPFTKNNAQSLLQTCFLDVMKGELCFDN